MKRLMMTTILLLICLAIFGCGELADSSSGTSMNTREDVYSKGPEQSTNKVEEEGLTSTEAESESVETSPAEESESTEPSSVGESESAESSTEVDRFGNSGLYDTHLGYVRGNEPDFHDGIVLKETLLLPAPCEELYELGVVYPGRYVEVLERVAVGTYDEADMLTESEWYLVLADDTGSIGYIKTEDVGNAAEISVEAPEPFQLKPGAPYYFSSDCTEPEIKDYPLRPLWVVEKNEEAHYWKLRSHGGLEIYINDPEVLEPAPVLGLPRNTRAG